MFLTRTSAESPGARRTIWHSGANFSQAELKAGLTFNMKGNLRTGAKWELLSDGLSGNHWIQSRGGLLSGTLVGIKSFVGALQQILR